MQKNNKIYQSSDWFSAYNNYIALWGEILLLKSMHNIPLITALVAGDRQILE